MDKGLASLLLTMLHVKLYCIPHTEEKLLLEMSQLPLLQPQGDVAGYRGMETGTPL